MGSARLELYLVGRHGNYFFDIFKDILVNYKINYQKYHKIKHFTHLKPNMIFNFVYILSFLVINIFTK